MGLDPALCLRSRALFSSPGFDSSRMAGGPMTTIAVVNSSVYWQQDYQPNLRLPTGNPIQSAASINGAEARHFTPSLYSTWT
ncbi:hypothetical protein AC578_3316 [Pseudocercospora eumusae]|uniref:Uncharacterized protein n=1 Tax=Pseudocercospora eumusae TaxID=321146 RepID=A0A139HCF0_9PEZI|nr:hypothetical protein AC578_3316 [Pseudocercospora eumusae]